MDLNLLLILLLNPCKIWLMIDGIGIGTGTVVQMIMAQIFCSTRRQVEMSGRNTGCQVAEK